MSATLSILGRWLMGPELKDAVNRERARAWQDHVQIEWLRQCNEYKQSLLNEFEKLARALGATEDALVRARLAACESTTNTLGRKPDTEQARRNAQ